MKPSQNLGMQAVMSALDTVDSPVSFFIRDDDTGWNDERLFALLDCTRSVGVPIDLAVIPQATGLALAAELRAWVDDANRLVGLHQHGHAHSNHEPMGRKCEFGAARDLDAQRADLVTGRQHLQDLFESRLDTHFTPPWNRCSSATPTLLATLGYTGLSRDRTAAPQSALPELPIDVDWCKHQRQAEARGTHHDAASGDAIALDVAARVRSGATVGLMLHHAVMSDMELRRLQTWLACWSQHPKARWQPMRAWLNAPPTETILTGA
jgi:hypothetical protein